MIAVLNLEISLRYTTQYHLPNCMSPVQQPVHSEDDGDVVRREADSLEDHHHGHQAGLGDTGRPDAGCCRGDRDSADLANGEGEVVDLGNEDGGHGLVESSPVHVDGGADG